jgi:hypothetical protein
MKQYLFLVGLMISMNSLNAQSLAFQENFDECLVPGLPVGWSVINNGNIGFRSDSTNASGNNGASGLNNLVIRNDENMAGTYSVVTASFDCTALSGLSVMWGSRVSSNFLASGSQLPSFWVSLDNGVSWDSVAFNDNIANSIWSEVNASALIPLSSLADHQPLVRFKWDIQIVGDGATTAGTYRIDDFRIFANQGVGMTSIEHADIQLYPNPVSDVLYIKGLPSGARFQIIDATGRVIEKGNVLGAEQWNVPTDHWSPGYYGLEIQTNEVRWMERIVKF